MYPQKVRDLAISGSGATQILWKVSAGQHVITSAVVAWGSGPETYVFPASPDGEITDWAELAGSFRGSLDHEAAISGHMEALRDAK